MKIRDRLQKKKKIFETGWNATIWLSLSLHPAINSTLRGNYSVQRNGCRFQESFSLSLSLPRCTQRWRHAGRERDKYDFCVKPCGRTAGFDRQGWSLRPYVIKYLLPLLFFPSKKGPDMDKPKDIQSWTMPFVTRREKGAPPPLSTFGRVLI